MATRRPPHFRLAVAACGALFCMPAATAAPAKGNPNSPLNDILLRLEAIQSEIQGLKSDIDAVKTELRADVDDVKREVITCTLRAKQAGLCDRVRETKASACFDMSVLEAKLGAKWLGRVQAKGEGGVGWTTGPDGKIVVDVRTPVAAIPSDFGLEIAPKLALKGEFCVEIPLEILPATGRTLQAGRVASSEAEFEYLAQRFEEIGAAVIPLVMDRIDSRLPDGQRLVAGTQAFERLGDGDLALLNGDMLSDPLLLDVIDVMPTPVMLRTALKNPAALRSQMPSLQGTAGQRVAALCHPQGGLAVVRSPLFSGMTDQICAHLATVPEFDDIAYQLLDIPEATSAIVDGLLDKSQPLQQNASNPFCSRPLFQNTRLCR